MNCYCCQGEMKEELTTFIHEQEGQIWVIRNVPAFVCQRCGEKEYTPEITRKILELVRGSASPVETVQVPIYDLALLSP